MVLAGCAITPGDGNGSEQVEQVGTKLLGSMSIGVQPSRSKKPARTAFAWTRSRRNVMPSGVAHFLQLSVFLTPFRSPVTSIVSLHRSHLTVMFNTVVSRSSIP